jgi:hypothetical protein
VGATLPAGSRHGRPRGLAWLVLLFVVSLPAVTARIYASDEAQYFAYLRSLWFDRDVSFENEYQHFYDAGITRNAGFHETFLERTTEAGRRINFATIGCAILWAPFYAAADVTARVAGYDADGYSPPYVAAVSYASALYGFLALVVAVATARRLAGDRARLGEEAPLAALAVWLGTPLVFYMYVAPPMSHATSAFAVAVFVYAWVRVRERWTPGGFAVLGALAALVAMVREQDAFFVVGPAVDLGAWFVRADAASRKRALIGMAAGSAAFAVCYLPQALAYMALNGHLGPTRLVARKMTWTAPHALEVLWSVKHGFLVWTPLAALAIAALAWLPRAARGRPRAGIFALALVAAVAAQVYVAGSVESWTVAGAFGQRRFIALSALLVLGVASGLAVAGRWGRRAWMAAIVLGVWWNLGLMAQFGAGTMNRQKLEPATLAYTTFLVLPRELPSLAWRYAFDRRSFYKPRSDAPAEGRP